MLEDSEVSGIPALHDKSRLRVDNAPKNTAMLLRKRDAPDRNTPHGAPPVFKVATAQNGTVVQEVPHAQKQTPLVLLIFAAAFPRLVFVDAVGQQRFGQECDLVVTEVERADVVRRHAHHHLQVGSDGDTFYDHVTQSSGIKERRDLSAAAQVKRFVLRVLRNRFRRVRFFPASHAFGDHPRCAVHVRENVEQVGRLFMELRQPVLDIGGALLAGRRGEAQHRTAQGRRKFSDQFLPDITGISVARAKRTVQTLRMPRAVRNFVEKRRIECRALRKLPFFGADDPVERRRIGSPVTGFEQDGTEPRLLRQHPVEGFAGQTVRIVFRPGRCRKRGVTLRLSLRHIRLVDVEDRIITHHRQRIALPPLLLRQAVVFRQLNLLTGFFVADVEFPEEDRERTGAFEDIQALFLGLFERHKERRTVASDLREEQQHQGIPAPVGRAAQVARKTVREVGDPRLAPLLGERLHFLYHQLRQLRSDLFNQILIHCYSNAKTEQA